MASSSTTPNDSPPQRRGTQDIGTAQSRRQLVVVHPPRPGTRSSPRIRAPQRRRSPAPPPPPTRSARRSGPDRREGVEQNTEALALLVAADEQHGRPVGGPGLGRGEPFELHAVAHHLVVPPSTVRAVARASGDTAQRTSSRPPPTGPRGRATGRRRWPRPGERSRPWPARSARGRRVAGPGGQGFVQVDDVEPAAFTARTARVAATGVERDRGHRAVGRAPRNDRPSATTTRRGSRPATDTSPSAGASTTTSVARPPRGAGPGRAPGPAPRRAGSGCRGTASATAQTSSVCQWWSPSRGRSLGQLGWKRYH